MRGANLYQCERQFFIEQKADELIEDVFFDAAWTRARRRRGHRVAIERRHARRHRKRSRVPHGWSHARRRLLEAVNELLAHLVGDYILQTDAMATKKTKSWWWALFHAAAYTASFLALTRNPLRLGIIFATHAAIDRYRLARFIVAAKNWTTHRTWIRQQVGRCAVYYPTAGPFATNTGYSEDMPPWMAVWLLIIADNTLHLLINHAALSGRPQQQ
jgi:hypothetical protein